MASRGSDVEAFRERRRGEVAAAIVRLVSEGPAHDLTVTDVVKVAGISRKTFYKYFEGLSGAMLFAQEWAVREIRARALGPEASGVSGLERLLGLLADYARVGVEAPELIRYNAYFDHTLRRTLMDGDERRRYDERYESIDVLVELFHRGQEDGSIRADLEPAEMVETLSRAVSALMQRLLVTEDRPPVPATFAPVETELAVWRRFLSPSEPR